MTENLSFVVSAFDFAQFVVRFPDDTHDVIFHTLASLNKAKQTDASGKGYGEGSGNDLIAYSTYFRRRIKSELGLTVVVDKGYE